MAGSDAPQVAGQGATGQVAGAWEQNTANTYPGGPVVSQGAARLDVGPAGTVARVEYVQRGHAGWDWRHAGEERG